MLNKSFVVACAAAWLLALTAAAPAQEMPADAQGAGGDVTEASDHWKDFVHYARIARPELAVAHGKALLQVGLSDAQVLQVVEASRYANNYQRDLFRMKQMDGEIADVAADVDELIEKAKIAVIRNPTRIRSELERLAKGLRPNKLATARLAEAGQYAAPEMVRVILGATEGDKDLRPYVIQAMVRVGRPLVVPLSEALSALTAEGQQDIARVLARIGYPSAMPYLKALLETGELDPQTAKAVQTAFDTIAQRKRVSADLAAAQLFYRLAEDYYQARESLILEPEAAYNVMWAVNARGDLDYLRIPTPIFHDVMAMRTARRALQLDATLSPALSLWLAANFRRENNLPDGANDPSYGEQMRSGAFYAMLAGPSHIKPVLARAIGDRDPEVALDAIDALAGTAGVGSLVSGADAVLAAMNYPDRRVRFETAIAIAKADAAEPFSGSGRVIPVLAEAVRQSEKARALVVAEGQQTLNELTASVRKAGRYDVLPAGDLEQVNEALVNQATADLIVIRADQAFINAFRVQRQTGYKLQATPMVVIAQPGSQATVNAMFRDDASVIVTDSTASDEQIANAIEQVIAIMAGDKIDARASEQYAVRALRVMRDLAINASPVFDVSLAQAPLIEALGDDRDAVVDGAAQVLALLESPQAQRAIAGAALDDNAGTTLRVKLLGHLADSFKRLGPHLDEAQVRDLQALVGEARGRLADAAAQAFGAATMPTAMSTDLITR